MIFNSYKRQRCKFISGGFYCALVFFTTILVGCESGDTSGLLDSVNEAELNVKAITVTPGNGTLELNRAYQFTATASPDGNDITSHELVRWSSSDPTIANVSQTGLVTGLQNGTVTISATIGDVIGTTQFTASDIPLSSIAIVKAGSDPNLQTRACEDLQLEALGTYDGVQRTVIPITGFVDWQPPILGGTGSVQFQDSPKGKVTVMTDTAFSVQASLGGVLSDVSTINVIGLNTITVTPAEQTLTTGVSSQYQAQGHYLDDSQANITANALWTTSNANASFPDSSPSGQVRTAAGGVVEISAHCGSMSGKANLTITERFLKYLRFRIDEDSGNENDRIKVSLAGDKEIKLELVAYFSDSDSPQPLTSGVTWTIREGSTDIVTKSATDKGKITVTAIAIGAAGNTEGRAIIDAKYQEQQKVFVFTVTK